MYLIMELNLSLLYLMYVMMEPNLSPLYPMYIIMEPNFSPLIPCMLLQSWTSSLLLSPVSHYGTEPLPPLAHGSYYGTKTLSPLPHISCPLFHDCTGFYFKLFFQFQFAFLLDCVSSEKIRYVGIFPLCFSARFSCCLIWGSWVFPLGTHLFHHYTWSSPPLLFL